MREAAVVAYMGDVVVRATVAEEIEKQMHLREVLASLSSTRMD